MVLFLIGGSGFLGKKIHDFMRNKVDTYVLSRTTPFFECKHINFDITNFEKNFFNINSPDIVINLSAITDVDFCERFPEQAHAVHVQGVSNLVGSLNPNVKLFQFSTDQVYDGSDFHKEASVKPINTYARTKFLGEKFIIDFGGIVIRTNFVGWSCSSNNKSLANWIVDSSLKNKKITLFDDIIFNPIYINDIPFYLEKLFSLYKCGIYNLGSTDCIDKYNFGLKLLTSLSLSTSFIIKGKSNKDTFYAKRPKNMCMNVSKIENLMKIKLTNINDLINKISSDYEQKNI